MRSKSSYNLLPMGDCILNDNSSVGKQIMEKMGFNKGLGLGKKNDGIVEPIKPQRNTGTKGFGATYTMVHSGSQQMDDYSSLLQSLHKKFPPRRCSSESKLSSLEEKSKASTRRIHYGKFTRAKDVANYDNSALKAIIGDQNNFVNSADLTIKDGKSKNLKRKASDIENDDESDCNEEFGVKTKKSSLSAAEYFKQTLASKVSLPVTLNKTNEDMENAKVNVDGKDCIEEFGVKTIKSTLSTEDYFKQAKIAKTEPQKSNQPTVQSSVKFPNSIAESVWATSNVQLLSGYIHY